jgi:ferric iron reductase protein FhuF
MDEVTACKALAREFRTYLGAEEKVVFPVEGSDLLTAFGMDRLLKETGEYIGATKPHVAGSLFVKRYYCQVPLAALYSITQLQRSFDFSLANLSFGFDEDRQWCIRIKHTQMSVCPPQDRERWRQERVYRLFTETVGPVFRTVAERTGVGMSTLWAHLSFAVYHRYELWLKGATFETERRRIHDDFHFLTSDAPAGWFEGVEQNPFAEEYVYFPHPKEEGTSVRLRQKCCFNYCLPEGRYCYTCPGLSEEERVQKIIGA